MRFAAFLLLLALAPAALAQAAGPGHAAAGMVERCAQSVDPALAGLEALESACPGLRQALIDSGYLPFLSSAQQQALVPRQLIELRDVVERYRKPSRPGEIEVDSLDRVLRSLQQQPESQRPPTLLEQLQKWLRELMDRQSNADPWLANWLDGVQISDAVTRVVTNVLILLVICLALAAIINELRVAGVLRRRRAAGSASPAAAVHAAPADRGAIGPVDSVPALLRELVATLVRTGRLEAERSLTHRELGLRAAFDAVDQRECFQRVTSVAERIVYGGCAPPAKEYDAVLEAGRALNSKLGGAA